MFRRAIVLAAFCLVAGACGSRLSEESRALINEGGGNLNSPSGTYLVSGGNTSNADGVSSTGEEALEGSTELQGGTEAQGGTEGSEGSAGGGGGTGTGTGGGGTGTGGGGTGGGTGTGGGGTGTGGGGTGGGTTGSTCTAGGTDVGITDTEIRVGNVSTLTGPIPEFGRTGVNGAKAYFNYVNAKGGVCGGRKLVLTQDDDRLQSATNKAAHDKLQKEVFAFVGSITVVDDGAAQSLEGTNIAHVSLGISDLQLRSPNNFSSTPLNPDKQGNGVKAAAKYFKEKYGISKAGLIFPAQATAKSRALGYKSDLEAAGFEVVLESEVSVVETNYNDDAKAVQANGVQLLMTTLEITGMVRLAQALDTNGYFPVVPFYGAQAYGKRFLSDAGAAAAPTTLGLAYHIFEEADAIPAVKNLLTFYAQAAPGADLDFFAIESWAAADMFVTALNKIQGPPSRDALMAELRKLTSFDASGLKAPSNPAGKSPASCFLVAKVVGGKWVKDHPAGDGFECGYA